MKSLLVSQSPFFIQWFLKFSKVTFTNIRKVSSSPYIMIHKLLLFLLHLKAQLHFSFQLDWFKDDIRRSRLFLQVPILHQIEWVWENDEQFGWVKEIFKTQDGLRHWLTPILLPFVIIINSQLVTRNETAGEYDIHAFTNLSCKPEKGIKKKQRLHDIHRELKFSYNLSHISWSQFLNSAKSS